MTSPSTIPSARAAEQELNAQLSKPPGGTSSPSTIVSWVSSIVATISAWITAVFGAYDKVILDLLARMRKFDERITAVEEAVESDPDSPPAAVPTASTPKATWTPSRSRCSRCAKCHAQGHSAAECASTDPAAVRRRVAQNAKARGSRRSVDQSLLRSLATAPHQLPAIDLLRPPPLESNQVALIVAESAELRRRVAQSRRDRNRARKGKVKEDTAPLIRRVCRQGEVMQV